MSNLAKALQALTTALGEMNVGKPSGKTARRRRARARKRAQMQSNGGGASTSQSTRKRRRRGGGVSNLDLGEGVIRLRRREQVKTLTSGTGGAFKDFFDIIPSGFSLLGGISKSFERSSWHSVHVYWKPMVGAMVGGLVTFGVDWDFSGTQPDRSQISSYTPNATFAVREDRETARLIVPAGKLQSRRWYSTAASIPVDQGPCRIWIAGQCEKPSIQVGEIWVEYDVTMQGTRPA